jgi:hypothetical protein
VSVCTAPSLPVTVVVTVAGRGESVVEEQPDHVPVQLEKGPQPAVQVVCETMTVSIVSNSKCSAAEVLPKHHNSRHQPLCPRGRSRIRLVRHAHQDHPSRHDLTTDCEKKTLATKHNGH